MSVASHGEAARTHASGRRGLPGALARLGPLAGVIAAGGLFAAACPPHEWSLAAWAVPGLLLVSARRLRPYQAFLCGLLYAVIIGSTITNWAPYAANAYFDFDLPLARAFILGVHAVNPGIPCGLLVLLYALACRRLPSAHRALVGACLWVGSEWLRTWSLGWELLGHSQFRTLALIQIADLGGVYAVSFVMAFASIATAELLTDLRRARLGAPVILRRLLLPAATIAVTLVYGVASWHAYGAPAVAQGDRVEADARTIAIVQGNVPNQFRWKRAFFGRTLATYAQLTNATRAASPDLIVWPENAVSFYINREALLRAQMRPVAATARDGLLVGAPRRGSGRRAYNSAYLLGADGETQGVYDKRRLLPFGEYNPLPWFGRESSPQDLVYTPGGSAQLLRAGRLSLGPLICFEVLYPDLVRDLVRQGAEVLVNLSNDSWMDAGDGAAPRQHFSMAVFRAVETRRYLVRVASSGESGFVNPYGVMYSVLPKDRAATAAARVRPRSGQSLYVRWGDAWVLAALLLSALLTAGNGHASLFPRSTAPRP